MSIMHADPDNYKSVSINYTLSCKVVSMHSKYTHFKGFARTRWPSVTKLDSWLDMKDANEDTLQQ